MHVFAKTPFRYLGIDYPYGNFDVSNDTLARTMVAAGYVIDASVPSTTGLSVSGTPDGTKFLGDDFSWKSVPAASVFTTDAPECRRRRRRRPVVQLSGRGLVEFRHRLLQLERRDRHDPPLDGWRLDVDDALSGDFSSFSANGGCVLNESAGVLLDVLVTGTPGAAMTATLSR
jgi:hypothetical protein